MISGRFQRMPPAKFPEKNGVPLGWFVISHKWMDSKQERRRSHGRWFKLETSLGSVYRVLRFSASLAFTEPSSIVIDYPAWLDLYGRAEDVSSPLNIRIVRARWWQTPRLAVSHPDPNIRLTGWLAILSVALGIVSALLGMWSIWMAFTVR